ncbi:MULTISPECIES: hypothetical protein [Halococcus]|uniref:Uncharacterized protein n=1 Tax=Halococcus salifodinae DSM 8989 TaxID=1227456 RepID=M0N6Q4_9EURY|nr:MULTISPECIES: hypothetical protein [Halococcus]EMA53238.1 hypothetical protein C450_07987 [Halococcus salifodinae DSM 8989]
MNDRDGSDGTTITRMGLRRGGWIGYNQEGVYVDRDDETKIKIEHANVTQVGLKSAEWDLVVMSLLLVGLGVFVGVTRNPLVGVGFAVVGLASLYWSYRKRHELVIHVANERKPIAVYPIHPTECHETLADRVRTSTED